MDLERKFPNYSEAAREAKNLAINNGISVSIVNDNGEWVLRPRVQNQVAATKVTIDGGLSFLGLDFGTSNCVASAFNDAGIQEFVKLDGDSTLLPTVLFVPRVDYSAEEVDEQELEVRLRRARIDERNRHQKDLSELGSILENYDQRNKPRIPSRPVKPKIEDYSGNKSNYDAAYVRYEAQLIEYGARLENHAQSVERYKIQRSEFERAQREYISPIATDDALRKSLTVAMQRENSEAAESKYWDQTFFSAMTKGSTFVYGREAIRLYSEDPMSGFFMRSPKSFLATELKPDYKNVFLKIVEKILGNIKEHAERHFSRSFKGVVLGRPVNYHGVRGDAGNSEALEIMRVAAKNVGFEAVHFFFEPVAAALSISASKIPSDLSLVVDVGGGTTDCSLIRGAEKSSAGVSLEVSRSGGSRIGGTDFDQSIAWMLLMPAFGKNDKLKSGLPLPITLLHDAIATRDLPAQIRFRKAKHSIEELLNQVSDKSKIYRFLKMQELQAQHKVILEAERLKILASNANRLIAHLGFIENDLEVSITEEGFDDSIRNSIEKVLEQVRLIVGDNGERPSVVFATGGMSQSPVLLNALQSELGEEVRVERLDSMSAVGKGLGIVANALTSKDPDAYDSMIRLGLTA
jgi:hypothetical chaperone protein